MIGKKITFSLLALILLISWNYSVFAQNGDDPNIDQIPKSTRNNPPVQQRPIVPPIISSDGYDNFFLGVDFAEPHVSSNPQNPLQIFAFFNKIGNVGINSYSTLNAFDWFTNNPVFVLSTGDPVSAYDSLGNLFVENMYQPGSNITGCYVAVSSNNGVNWAQPVWAINGYDKNWIAADQTGGPFANYVYTTMTGPSSYQGSFARSTDHGQTFQSTWSCNTQNLPGMMVCVGPKVTGGDVPGGYVYVVTNYGSVIAPTYYFYRSSDGGVSFSSVSSPQFAGYLGKIEVVGGSSRPTVQNMRTRPYPFIVADNSYGPYRGRLYLVYATNVPNQDNAKPDIFCRYSTDAGTSWSSPVTINDDANSTNNHQWFPSIWCDKETGKFYAKWFDTRNCPTSDSAEVYASYSTNGGQSFVTNQKISNAKFKIYCSSCGGGGYPATYQGDYDAITSNKYTSTLVWSDFRTGQFGSYTAFFPDFAMKLYPPTLNTIVNNDSTFVNVSVPSVKLYTDKVKFTAEIVPTPTTGTVTLNFVNNKDSITTYPDSVRLRIKTSANVTPGGYTVNIYGRGTNGTPVHKRSISVNINAYEVSVGTNRNGTCSFKINGASYTTRQTIVFNTGSTVNVSAVSPYTAGNTRYIFTNWSDNGDTTHNVTVNGPLNLTANYKVQYNCIVMSDYSIKLGSGFHDSAVAFTFGVYQRIVVVGSGVGQLFRGWDGAGNGSYTSTDTTGLDTMVTLSIINPIIETARWTQIPVGINNISSEIPDKFAMHQNYPNPFNPTTNIRFDLPKATQVKLIIYDALGREIETLVNEIMKPGFYSYTFNGKNLASGVYFFKIITSDYTDIKKMLILK
ncbi:MAG: T9SS type A sorting domain-containing protein [Ignavibacteria bacterium]|jgi:hypothetical protein